MENFVLITAALFTSTMSAMIGMGGGIVLLGLMAILMPQGYLVIALHGMIQLMGNGTRAFVFKDANFISFVISFFLTITVEVPISHDFNKSSILKKFLAILLPIILLFLSTIE